MQGIPSLQFFYRFIPPGSVVLAVLTFGSYALGLVRDRIFAQQFGASVSLDSYTAAFLVPDFLFNFLVASGIAAAAVPLFLELRRRSAPEADHYITSLLVLAVIVMAATGAGIFFTASWLSRLVAPGLSPEGQALVTRLMRILAFSPILFAASNALGAMLVARRRFFWYALSPMAYNVGIIGGALWLAPRFGIVGVALGTIVGAFFHLAARLLDACLIGWRPTLVLRMPATFFRRTLRLMAPKMIGHPVELLTFWVFTSIASLLSPGSITVLGFARNFQSVPVSLLGITLATTVFPALTEAALTSRTELVALFRRTFFVIWLISSLAALLLYAIRQPLVTVLLGGGAFDAEAVARTALVLGVFCLSIPTESVSHLLARAFYATQNTVIPVVFSVVSFLVAGAGAYLLTRHLGIIGLPLGFFAGSFVKVLGLLFIFWRRMQRQVLQGV